MNRHGVVEVALGRAHLHRYGETLQQLIAAAADDVDADDFLVAAGDDEFYGHLLFACGERVVHRRECRLINLHLSRAIGAHRLRLSKAYGADRRMTEDDGRDVAIGEVAALWSIEDAIRKPAAGCDRDRRQRSAAGDIADGINTRYAGLLK